MSVMSVNSCTRDNSNGSATVKRYVYLSVVDRHIGRRTAAVREETLWRCQAHDAVSNHGRTDTSAADFAIILMVFYSYIRTSGPGSGLHSSSPVSVHTDGDELLATMNEDDEWPIGCYNNNQSGTTFLQLLVVIYITITNSGCLCTAVWWWTTFASIMLLYPAVFTACTFMHFQECNHQPVSHTCLAPNHLVICLCSPSNVFSRSKLAIKFCSFISVFLLHPSHNKFCVCDSCFPWSES